MSSPYQHTLGKTVSTSGIGLHSGEMVKLTLRPSSPGTGIIFRRRDVASYKAEVRALYSAVCETTLGTTLRNEYGVSVATVEHLMAALWGCGVDNVIVELDAPEVPIMDGSSEPFIALIERAGVMSQGVVRREIEVLETLTFREGESVIRLEPATHFSLQVEIDFPNTLIGRQSYVFSEPASGFKSLLSEARTFGMASDLPRMHAMGLARGGSLENAILVDGNRVVNEEGLRFDDEFVRHKALDCIGDLFLAGYRLKARVTAYRPGHGVNNKALRALFDDASAWRFVSAAGMPARAAKPARAPMAEPAASFA